MWSILESPARVTESITFPTLLKLFFILIVGVIAFLGSVVLNQRGFLDLVCAALESLKPRFSTTRNKGTKFT